MIYITDNIVAFRNKDKKTYRKFIRFLRVKRNSYAARIAYRVYNEFFGNRYNLKRYYRQYYRKEFSSCEEFLINRWNMSDELAKTLAGENYYFTYCDYKKDRLSWWFSNDKKMVNLFSKFVGGIAHEN